MNIQRAAARNGSEMTQERHALALERHARRSLLELALADARDLGVDPGRYVARWNAQLAR